MRKHQEKFGAAWSNRYHMFKSLTYFADAEDQPMPMMMIDVSWEQIKRSIVESVLELDPGAVH